MRPYTSLGVYKRLVLPQAGRGIVSGGIAVGKAPTGLHITSPVCMLQQATLMKLIDSPRRKRTTECGSGRGVIWEVEGGQEWTRERWGKNQHTASMKIS